jgi:hypothetical protein
MLTRPDRHLPSALLAVAVGRPAAVPAPAAARQAATILEAIAR